MKIFFVIALLFFTTTVAAQEHSLLWKISGNGLQQDSYLYGTVHLMCPEDFSMSEKLNRTIKEVEAIYFEIDVSTSETMVEMQAYMEPDSTFLAAYDDKQIAFIDSVLTSHNLSIKLFEMLSPAGVTSLISVMSFDCPNPMDLKSYELEIRELAQVQGKVFGDLETIAFQMELLQDLFTHEEFLKSMKTMHLHKDLTAQMIDYYKAEDLAGLSAIMFDPNWMTAEMQQKMLAIRNSNWVEQIPDIVEDQQTLFAVGVGHLLGDIGLIELLRQKGFEVTPVTE